MTNTLNMIELRLNASSLFRFAREQRLNKREDSDLGYLLHAWLKALLYDLTPNCFRYYGGDYPRVLAYTQHAAGELIDQAKSFATPLTLAVTRIEDLRYAKALPQFKSGRRLGFEVLSCPVTRKANKEKDAFLHRLESLEGREERTSLRREVVYCDWLSNKMAGVVLEDVAIAQFQLVKQYRKGQAKKTHSRPKHTITHPQVLFRGILQIENSEGFNRLLVRGVGRHRSFGYGMLLLRPA